MGIVLKRRDNAPIVKIAVGGIVREILMNHSAKGAISFIDATLKKIFNGEFGWEKFIVSKRLGDNYVNPEAVVQHCLNERIKARSPGSEHAINDRVPYVYVVTKGEILNQGQRVEDPEFAKMNNMQIDYLFYITNQIMKPAIQFLELLIEKPEQLFEFYMVQEINRLAGLKPLTYYCKDNYVTADNAEDFFSDVADSDKIDSEIEIKKKKKTAVRKKKEDHKLTVSEPVFNEDEGGFLIDDF